MADRAVSDDASEKSVVDLFNDDRWQARLEEARARREIALREKAGDDGSNTPKRKLMPWEEEITDIPVEPLIQSPTSDRVDFADRVDVMRETIKKEDDPTKLGMVAGTAAMPTSFDDLLTDDAIVADDLDWTPPPKEPHSAVSLDAPDVIDLAARYASTLTAVPDIEPLEDPVADEEEAALALAPKAQKNHPPALLIVGILALAVLPFTQTVPPLDKGPAMPFPPSFRLQPALGLTTAMLWRPVETSSQDWARMTDWVLPLATIFSPPTPEIQTAPDALVLPAIGEAAPDFIQPQSSPAAVRGLQPPALDGASIERLPGAFTRRPEPRPDENAPFVDTRAPSRLPDLATGNEVSPRVAPVKDSDASSLDVTRLEAVSYDEVPVRSADVVPTLAEPLSGLQLTILVPRRQDVAVAQQYAEDAAARGHKIGSVKDVSISISTRNLRYFHAADRAEAERLAEAYGAEARDFTWFAPKPERGTAELWLEGKSSSPAPVKKAVRIEVPAVKAAPSPQVVIVRKPEGLFSRLFGGHKVGTTVSAGGDGDSTTTVATVDPSPPTSEDTSGEGTDTDTGTGTDTTGTEGTDTTETSGSGTGTTEDTTTDDTGTGTTDDTGTTTDTTDTTGGTTDTSSDTDTSDDSSSSPGSGASSGGGGASSSPAE